MNLQAAYFGNPAIRPKAALVAGLVAAALFVLLTIGRLEGQGVYYDELHQTPSAFFYMGKTTDMFTALQFGGIPLLNMTYSGALKSAMYGWYMYLSGSGFTVTSWRLLGIIFVALGIVLFCLIAGRSLPSALLLPFLALMLTDATILLTSRHDWGPTALALLLRMIFLAIWVSREMNSGALSWKNFLLGALVGLSIFEKLSSLVLLGALVLMIAMSRHRPAWSQWRAVCAGLMLGGLPVIAVNVLSFIQDGSLISLADVGKTNGQVASLPMRMIGFLYHYPALGQGKRAQEWILGHSVSDVQNILEGLAIVSICVFIAVLAWRHYRSNRMLRMAGILVLCYVSVAVGLAILPRTTGVHHWLTGTPFQYLAIVCALAGAAESAPRSMKNIAVGIALLLLLRLPALFLTESALLREESSKRFDPSYSTIGHFAAYRADSALFIAADWGMATSLYCLSDGRARVYEPIWRDSQPGAVKAVLDTTKKQVFYLFTRTLQPALLPQRTRHMIALVDQAAEWREVSIEAELRDMKAVSARKFVRHHRVPGTFD